MKVYRIKDWDIHFENNKSREREDCSFVCVPNKQHGMGFSRVMAEPDGAAIYGIFQLILGACSQQKKPRAGWLTGDGRAPDGHQTGTAWAPEDLALKFRRPEAEIARALEVLSSQRVGWIECFEIIDGQLVISSARQVPAKCPPSARQVPLNRIEENRIEENRKEIYGVFRQRIGKWFNRRETTQWTEREEKSLRRVVDLNTPEEDVCILERYYTAKIDKDDYRRRDIETLLNNWNGEIDRARRFVPRQTESNQIREIIDVPSL